MQRGIARWFDAIEKGNLGDISFGMALATFYGSDTIESMSTPTEYVYVTGNTSSKDFVTTSGAYDTSYNGGQDGFVRKLSADAGSPPKVTTGAATSITKTSAKLSGTVNPEGLTTSAWFEGSSKSGSYTKKSRKKTNLTGTADKTGSFTVYGLSPGTTYYYRLAATNSAGTSNGSELSFTTLSK